MKHKNILLLVLWIVVSSNLMARDATDITRVVFNPATVQTLANEVKAIAIEVSETINRVDDRLTQAESRSAGTVAALIDANSCLHDPNFTCTEANLTHVYQTKAWTTPGQFNWTVPTGITQIYITVKGSDGTSGYMDDVGCPNNGVVGQNSSMTINSITTISSGGSPAGYSDYTDSCYGVYSATLGKITNKYINVSSGQSANILVGGGVNGSVSIRY